MYFSVTRRCRPSHHNQVQFVGKEGTVFFFFWVHSLLFFWFSSFPFLCFQQHFLPFSFPLFQMLLKSWVCLVLISLWIAFFLFFCTFVYIQIIFTHLSPMKYHQHLTKSLAWKINCLKWQICTASYQEVCCKYFEILYWQGIWKAKGRRLCEVDHFSSYRGRFFLSKEYPSKMPPRPRPCVSYLRKIPSWPQNFPRDINFFICEMYLKQFQSWYRVKRRWQNGTVTIMTKSHSSQYH